MTDEPGLSRRAFDWFFRDRLTGEYVVAQIPNIALIVFLAARGLEWLLADKGKVTTALQWVGTAALMWWAVDEILRGVNPLRRLLGVGVLLVVSYGVVQQARPLT